MATELSPIELAETKIPIAWYEKINDGLLAAGSFGTYAVLYYSTFGFLHDHLSNHLIFGILALGSIVADSVTTAQALNTNQAIIKKGFSSQLQEQHSALTHVQTGREFIFHPSKNLRDISFCLLSTLMPPFGIMYTIGKTTASMNNFRLTRRIKLATDIAEERGLRSIY